MSKAEINYRTAKTSRLKDLEDPSKLVCDFYSAMYHHDKQDSPDKSRHSLKRRARKYFANLPTAVFVLDLGSGRRIFEKEYFCSFGPPNYEIVTLDFAEIDRNQLLVDRPNLFHIRADGKKLPFNNECFSGAVSNMAIDFMLPEALDELQRVLKAGSVVLINLHHPSLIPEDINDVLKNKSLSSRKKVVLTFWKYLKDDHVLFESEEQIRKVFKSAGFEVNNVQEARDKTDRWWEVDMVKTS